MYSLKRIDFILSRGFIWRCDVNELTAKFNERLTISYCKKVRFAEGYDQFNQ